MKELHSVERRMLREQLCAFYGDRCAYCLRPTRLKVGTVDHYLPEVLGGTNAWHNLRWACNECNGLKGGMHPDEWLQVMPKPVYQPTRQEVRLRLLQLVGQRQRALLEGRA